MRRSACRRRRAGRGWIASQGHRRKALGPDRAPDRLGDPQAATTPDARWCRKTGSRLGRCGGHVVAGRSVCRDGASLSGHVVAPLGAGMRCGTVFLLNEVGVCPCAQLLLGLLGGLASTAGCGEPPQRRTCFRRAGWIESGQSDQFLNRWAPGTRTPGVWLVALLVVTALRGGVCALRRRWRGRAEAWRPARACRP